MKNIIYLFAFIFINHLGYSQDIIYKRASEDSILAKITEVNIDNIKYRSYSNLDGPLYVIKKEEINRIVYSNGDVDHFKINESKDPKNHATICIIRPKRKGTGFNVMAIYEDDMIIGILRSNNYLKWKIDADKDEVIITSRGEGKDIFRIKPIAGKTYYLKQDHRMGWVKARPKISLIEEDEALRLLKKATEGERRWAE